MMPNYPWFAKYEKGVPQTIDIPHIPLQQILTDATRKFPNHVAVRMVLKYLPLGLVIQAKLTYAELNEATDRFAAGLQKLGVRKGDRVALMLPNLPQYIIAYFGTLKAGATLVNTNPTYTARELEHQLKDSGAETIVMITGLYERLAPVKEHTPIKRVILTDIPDSLSFPFKGLVEKQVRASGMMKEIASAAGIYRFADLLKAAAKSTPVPVSDEDVVLFQYSGGTTGIPKAAMLTHHNLVANVMQMNAWFANVEYGKEKTLCALPFFHVYGMTVGMLFSISTGAEAVIVPDPRNTTHILDVVQHEKITIYPGVPGMYVGVNNHKKVAEYNLHSIKACMSGGAALPLEVKQQFETLTGGKLVEGFGMSECSPCASANPLNGENRAGSIGLPVPNTELAVISLDADANGKYAFLPQGEEGEIVIKGPQVMKGYWNLTAETAATLDADGWLHTGDIGKMDADGYFYIVDRKKDLIIASGYKIVPREVEEVLFTHPAVQEAAVAGVPDPKRGETVKAFVILKEGQKCTEEELRTFCRDKIAAFKIPTAVEFRSDLPKSQIGKVLRRVLVQEEKDKLAKKG
jgi:long-chain acyl-CoA synthetase